ncbi:MAG: hypothetical protein AAGE89_01285 [Pseudomonadota bacterium]
MKYRILLMATALLSLTSFAEADPLRVRGTVSTLNEGIVTVENAAGHAVDVKLSDPVVLMYENIELSEVPENAYIAVPSVSAPDGNRRALAIIVFPEAMRGMNEGFKPWDLTDQSKMTNATIAKVVSRGGENVLTVSFGGQEQTIYVPSSAPVTRFHPTQDKTIRVGDNVVIFADDSKGSITGKYVGMHENGGLPPV